MSTSPPLHGKTALVTGVSRRRGIGFAVATKLASLGANVAIHHHGPHDLDLPWGGDDIDAVRAEVRAHLTEGAQFADVPADLSDPSTVPDLIAAAAGLAGGLDVLVCNHAKSGNDGSILDMTPERLSAFWEVNTRSTLLLTAEFARLRAPRTDEPRRPGDRITGNAPYAEAQGHVFWMTSGQIHGAMRGEVAYATSKAALAGVTATVAAELLELGIVLNTINPGPVNTGYMDPDTTDRSFENFNQYLASTPFGRVGTPGDPAELIGWLATPAGSWVVGQVLTSDGGFAL
ncbi:3-oxoacyl-[acyl-carrier protein] reductase [Plantibacter flavus]|uniref:3-oxoacyl-[acyl-carrier protein] reductase n=1 Tax=Plantibacter flavus TaxID=150123 RepID=A0A3N2BXJ2_9MICO|nr:SDR family oxidoreductase [Plantibacter flavus]ROR79991.1 3-oxoacyl-[acyl-carrier protein] reductase [Plantibacter flavus]SMG28267.1 3-oxoacyl-[acyl-carrier protein] reductase [Plantibacter flavus]